MVNSTSARWLIPLSVFGFAACLRPSITAVGPLLPDIGATTGLGTASLGVLGALPLILFGCVAPFAAVAVRRAGPAVVVRWVAIVLVLGIVLRSTAGVPGLWVGTAVLAGSIAIGNVLMPILVHRDYPRHAAMASGGNALMMGAFASLGSGLAVTFTNWTGDWRYALLIWAIMPLVIGAVWFVRRTDEDEFLGPAVKRRSMVKSPAAWWVTAYMGFQSLTFYLTITWLPTIEMSRGVSAEDAAFHLFVYLLVGAPFGLVVSWALHRTGRYLLIGVLAGIPMLITGLGLLTTDRFPLLWLLIGAPGSAATLTVAMLLMSHRAADQHEAAGLAAMANAGGYLLAAIAPVLAGLMHEWSGSWTPALVMLVVAAVLQVLVSAPAVGRQAT